jgi:hypothetical protein
MEEPVRVAVRTHHLVAGDRYLLCSDGLTDALEPEQICEVLHLPKAPDEIVGMLIELANAAGGADNIASVVIACELAQPASSNVVLPSLPRARRAPSAPPPELSVDNSPEIMMLSSDEDELVDESSIHVVPAESASPLMIDALEDFVAPRPPTAARDRGTKRTVQCGHCGAPMEPDAATCVDCGKSRDAT